MSFDHCEGIERERRLRDLKDFEIKNENEKLDNLFSCVGVSSFVIFDFHFIFDFDDKIEFTGHRMWNS